MSSYNKFNKTVRNLIDAKFNFTSDTFKIALTNTLPSAANAGLSDITEITAGNGYSAGGSATAITESDASGVATVKGGNVVFTASGGSIGPLRYAVLYDDTTSGDPLIAWWDYGSSVTLNNTETLTVAFDATNGIFQLS